MKGIIRKSYDFLVEHLGILFIISIISNIISNQYQNKILFKYVDEFFVSAYRFHFFISTSFLTIILGIIISTFDYYISIEIYKAIKEDRSPKISNIFKSIFNLGYDFFILCVLINIKVFLWYLLLVIPGIVKSLSYQRAIYLKIDDPTLTNSECFELAKEQMCGQKLNLFKLLLLISIIPLAISFTLAVFSILTTIETLFAFDGIYLIVMFILLIVLIVFSVIMNMLKIVIRPMFNFELNKNI